MTDRRSSADGAHHQIRRGLSLLEVIISTAILAASALMLTSLFVTGDRHTARAEERVFAQMVCQTKLDELIADPSSLISVQADVFRDYPGWMWSVDINESALPGLIQVRVAVMRIATQPTGADLAISTPNTKTAADDIAPRNQRPTFALARWLRYDGQIITAKGLDASSSMQDRLRANQP